MSRQTRRASPRARVEAPNRQVPVNTYAPVGVTRTSSSSANAAQALSRALGIGNQAMQGMAAERARVDADQATQDFAAGTVDRDRTGVYSRRASRLQAAADWTRDRQAFIQSINEIGLDSMEEHEVNEFLDHRFAEKYEGIDDADYAEFIAPRMAELRAQMLGQHKELQIEAGAARQRTDLMIAAEGMLETGGLEGFDYAEYSDWTSTFPADIRRDMHFSVLATMAVNHGMPELLENAPENHPGTSVPTFRKDPAFADRLRNSITQAQAARQAKLNEAAREAEAERQQRITDLEVEAVVGAMNGEGIDHAVVELTQLGERAAAVALDNYWHTRQTREPTAENLRGMPEHFFGQYRVHAHTGRLSSGAVLQMMDNGDFGYGEAGLKQAEELLRVARANEQRGESARDQSINRAVSTLQDRYNAQLDIFGNLDPFMRRLQGDSIQRLRQLTDDPSVDPMVALEQVKDESDALMEKDHADLIRRRDLTPADPELNLRALTRGLITVEQTVDALGGIEKVIELAQSGVVTEEGLEMIIGALND